MFAVLTFISIGHLLFGYIPEYATLMIFGICMVGLAVGLRRIFKHQEANKTDKNTAEDKR